MSTRPFLLLLGLLSSISVPAADWRVDPARSRLGFAYQAMGAEIQGEFNRFSANVQLDPAKPQRAAVSLQVDVASIDAGLPEATAEALTPGFLDAARIPRAHFTSTSVKPLDAQRFQVNGELNLKNQRRPISLIVRMIPEGKTYRLTGAIPVKRLDYNIGSGMWGDVSALANEIRIAFNLLLVPAPPTGVRK